MDQATQSLISALQAQAARAATDADLTQATPDQQVAALAMTAHARAAALHLQAQAVSSTARTRTVAVRATRFGAESQFALCQRELGDATRIIDVWALNDFYGLALTVGQQLTLPVR